jgi:hypothetical protein
MRFYDDLVLSEWWTGTSKYAMFDAVLCCVEGKGKVVPMLTTTPRKHIGGVEVQLHAPAASPPL